MLKKRLIFTLLYDSGHFMLSRNFRLQRVGNLEWLKRNYNFLHIAFFIDELIVLNVSRGEQDIEGFCKMLKVLTEGCFMPIAAGGGINSVLQARQLLNSGADKIVVNTPLFENRPLVESLVQEFGQQSIVGSVDIKSTTSTDYRIYTTMGQKQVSVPATEAIAGLGDTMIGEIYLNSIDRDGTGQGYDLNILDILPRDFITPVILAGGVGSSEHLSAGIMDPRVDAVATAHLFNFLGDGLQNARRLLINHGAKLATWQPISEFDSMAIAS